LRTRTLQDLAAERITGATVRGLNIWDLKRLPVPVPGKAEQEALAKRFDEESTRAARVAQLLAHQVALLQERRQVLITAAVSGLLDIPEVAA
jgi:type I restriction enzyme S subunit